jgi:hypothetical protein
VPLSPAGASVPAGDFLHPHFPLERLPRFLYPEIDACRTGQGAFREAAAMRNTPATSSVQPYDQAGHPHAWKVVGHHVIPVNDLREHSLTECWCYPLDDEGLSVHNSLDGRELYERGEKQVS